MVSIQNYIYIYIYNSILISISILSKLVNNVRKRSCLIKTGTSQVGAISKAQKAQNIFFGKKLEIFEKTFSFGKCCTVPKNVKGGPFLIYKHAFCSKITKNSKEGTFGDIEKISKRVAQCRKKIERGTL